MIAPFAIDLVKGEVIQPETATYMMQERGAFDWLQDECFKDQPFDMVSHSTEMQFSSTGQAHTSEFKLRRHTDHMEAEITIQWEPQTRIDAVAGLIIACMRDPQTAEEFVGMVSFPRLVRAQYEDSLPGRGYPGGGRFA